MAHIALYRSWRPQTFQEMVGQEHITKTLQNSLKEGRLSHAYLFSGPRGTGKTSAAKILAKAVNCERRFEGEPCNECEACRRITEGSVMDVIELDAASNNGVDEIRDIRDKVKYAPTEVRRKVYIIDEVHMLSIGASNALLKTLEEPPPHVMFVLATTEPHKLPVTIVSRCQRFDFRRVPLEGQVARLEHICREEGLSVERKALEHIARLSDGGMRDALSLLDQIISFSSGMISYDVVVSVTGGIASDQFREMAQAIKEKDLGQVLEMIDRFMQEGKSAERCIENLVHYFRDLLLAKMAPQASVVSQSYIDPSMIGELAAGYVNEEIFHIIEVLNHYQVEMKYATQPQILFEVALMKICSGERESVPVSQEERSASGVSSEAISQLTRRVAGLEQKLAELARGVEAGGKSTMSTAAIGSRSVQTATPSPYSRNTAAAPSSAKRAIAGAKLEAFLTGRERTDFKPLASKWGQVLQKVKEQKITVHAWLVNGDPVSVSDDEVLVAFKNTIHRETTEKPANKELIEQVIASVAGKPLRLQTIMLNDWEAACSGGAVKTSEVLELQPEDESGGKYKEDWINEAIELFGEDMVVIKEDE